MEIPKQPLGSLYELGTFWPCYRGHLGPSGLKVAKGVQKEFLEPLGPGAQKQSKTESFSTLF